MSVLFYSDSVKQLISSYTELISVLPLHLAARAPTFNHKTVFAAWKEGFAVALDNLSDPEAAVLSDFPQIDLVSLVNAYAADSSWKVALRKCVHDSGTELMCARCKIEHRLARLAIVEEANLCPQDALGRDNDDSITLMFWKLMAEKGGCKKCHERETVACLCAFDNADTTKVQTLLLQWSEKNAALYTDLHFRGARFLDFVLRRIKYETCLECQNDYQNIILPAKKQMCFCVHDARVQHISNIMCTEMSARVMAEPLPSVYRIVRAMLETFKFNTVRNGEVVVQD